ncbi:MAG: response regulator [Deltaproteobacteria bacterium]|nr:response regulator [Deltaproteobacteria bacterium]
MALTRERLEQLIARSSDSIVGTDRSGNVIYWNDGAKKVLGYDDEEVLGTHVGRLYPDVDEAKRVMRAMREAAGGGKDVVDTFQTTFMAKSGERIPVAISGTILRNEAGEEDGTIGFAKDLREILRKDQLATLGEVAIGLSHEINNPLNVILNQATLLERDIEALANEGDISVENERLDAIRREISRISEIVERLGEMVKDDTYETKGYIGPARMVDLRSRAERDQVPMERLGGLRILVADDDGGIARSLKEILTRDGCQVTTAGDGREALAALGEAKFDLVLSDVVMPNMDGYELFKAIQEQHPGLPVLMMTAFHYDKDHIIKRSRVAGLGAVLFKKPVDPDRLRQTILEAVRR